MYRKKFLITVLICGAMMSVVITGCNKDGNLLDGEMNSETENIQLRSAALGFANVNDYQEYVAQQCIAGNHENCCVLNGIHQVCTYPNHLGINCQGAHHHGANHIGQGNNCSNPNGTGFVDADGDGICDNCTGTGKGNNQCTNPNCTGFVDTNGDGVCDNHTGSGGGGHHGQGR